MSIAAEQNESQSLIRLEGDCTITSAAELKQRLIEGLASAKDLRLDLERAGEIDITVLQLLWAAGREASHAGIGMVSRVPETAAVAARDAGFDRFPGTAVQE